METLEIRVNVIRKQGKSKATGKDYDFLAYEGITSAGKKVELKFTRACKNVPNEVGKYVVEVPTTQISKDRTSIFNQYWIREVVSVKPFVKKDEYEELPF